MITIRPVQPGDVEQVAVVMRQIDVDECRAANHTPWQGLHFAAKNSCRAWTGVIDGRPEAMFGVVPINYLCGIGAPWFLGSERARQAQREFLKVAPVYLGVIEGYFPKMIGQVSARNTAAIRWLQRMGFVVEADVRHLRGEPMREFHKGYRNV